MYKKNSKIFKDFYDLTSLVFKITLRYKVFVNER